MRMDRIVQECLEVENHHQKQYDKQRGHNLQLQDRAFDAQETQFFSGKEVRIV